VPWSATSSRPTFCVIAPVKAPRSWPNSSLSIKPLGTAAQLSLTNAILEHHPQELIYFARDLLPDAGRRSFFLRARFFLSGHGTQLANLFVDFHQGLT